MATLEKIRGKAGLLVGIVGLALFAFIIGDFLNSGSTYLRLHQEKVAVINGKVINREEFQSRIDEMEHVTELQSGQSSLPDEYRVQIRQNVYSGIVEEVLLDKELEKLGMLVTADELFDMMQGENISPMLLQNQMFHNPQTGTFDKTAFLNFLKMTEDDVIDGTTGAQREQLLQYKTLRLYLEKFIKLQRKEQKYMTLLSKAISANKLDAKDAYNSQSASSDIVYVMQPYSSVPDSTIVVSKSEIEKLYNQRKSAFKQDEAKVIKYVVVNIVPSQEDYNKLSSEIEHVKADLLTTNDSMVDFVADNSETPYRNAFRSVNSLDSETKQFVTSAEAGDVYGPFFEQSTSRFRMFKLVDKTVAPDSVKFSLIVITNDGREKEVADSLLNVLKKGGNFAEIAAAHSADKSTSDNGGDVGWITEEQALGGVNEEFKNALFSATLNEAFKFTAPQGVFLVKLTEKTANVNKYKLAEFDKTLSPSSTTYSNLYNSLNQFITKNRDINKMDTAAQNAGYTIYSDVSVKSSDENVGSIPKSRQIVRWAFEHKKGDISDIQDCDNKYFVVAAMQGTVRKGFRSLSSLESTLKAELIAQKKGEKIAEELKAKNLTSMEAYAQAMNTTVDSVRFINFSTPRISGIGVEPKLNAKVSMANLNTVSAPVAGSNGVYVFEVVNRTDSQLPYDEKMQEDAINSSGLYKYGYQSMQYLINNANIEDTRIRFF